VKLWWVRQQKHIKRRVFFSSNLHLWRCITHSQLHTWKTSQIHLLESSVFVFMFSFSPLLICITVYGKEHNNYKKQTIHLWGKMDLVTYIDSVSLNINHRMTIGHCCWIDDCNWQSIDDSYWCFYSRKGMGLAVLKYNPYLNSFTQPMVCLTPISPWENQSCNFRREFRVMCLLPSQLEAMKFCKVGNQNAKELPLVLGGLGVIAFV